MQKTDRVIRIGGDGGEGVLSCGELLSQELANVGYEIFTLQVIPAEIKGGHANFLVRADARPLHSQGEQQDVLVCFNEEAFTLLKGGLKPGGLLIFDPERFTPTGEGFIPYPVALEHLALHEVKAAIAKNVVALGALSALLGIPYASGEKFIRGYKKWLKRGPAVADRNVHAFKVGYEFVKNSPPPLDLTMPPPAGPPGQRMVIYGNDMISIGALVAGVKFYAGYPITPASTILEFMERELPRFGGYAIQTEDEIAAISAIIGGSFTGAKSMTATSGPGLSLMIESLGLASMTETPIVIIDVMRGGPSTGLPTKVEQSDLNLAVYGGHGDSPRIVVAASDVEDCFHLTIDAFNLAEKYQMPVILLSDYSLSTRTQAIPKPDFAAATARVENRLQPSAEEIAKGYLRYKHSPSGISPMAIPGTPGAQFTATGLEHNESGAPHMTGPMHKAMSDKRFTKLAGAAKEPGFTRRWGPAKAKVGIVSWGTTTGSVREAIERAQVDGLPIAALHCRMLWPLPDEIRVFVEECETILVPELNYQGQLAQILRAKYLKPVVQLNKVEGLPFTASEIYARAAELCGAPVGAAQTAGRK